MWAAALPWIAKAIAGPLAGVALDTIKSKFPQAGKTVDTVKDFLSGMTPEQLIEAKKVDADLQYKLAALGYDSLEKLEEFNVRGIEAVNKTMQTEAIAERWPQYGWRPAIGFAFAFNLVQVSLVASFCYIAAIFFGKAEFLTRLPEFITAITTLNATALPILGVAAYFRGKMQADPAIPIIPKI